MRAPSLLFISLLLAGCGADVVVPGPDGTRAAGADPEVIVNQSDRDDITVIRAWESIQQLHPSSLFDDCTEIEHLGGDMVRIDCTDAAEAVIANAFPGEPGRLAHQFVLIAYRDGNGGFQPGSSGIPCTLTRIETASRAGALPYMKRLGFYFSRSSRQARHLAVDDLDVAFTQMGHDGHLRVVHRFYAALPCWAGTASSSYYASYQFKPYMDFDGTDGKIYRNWDPVPQNYVLTGGSGITEFDRSGEVLLAD